MQSLASAARLLRACTSVNGLEPLLRELGFKSHLVPLGDDHRALLDIPGNIEDARVASGRNALRALAFAVPDGMDGREMVQRVAAKLTARAPQLFFLLAAVEQHRRRATLAAFSATGVRPRVAALVVHSENIVDSDSETVCALAAACGGSDVTTYCRWIEILGRESTSRRFFRELERVVGSLAQSVESSTGDSDAAELALLYVSRLVFLSFLETRGWLDGDHGFLANRFADCMASGGCYHRRVLNPLFFGTLNTPPRKRAKRARDFGRVPFLNGGLFSRSHLERRTSTSFFTDEALGEVFGSLLSRYRFTAREDGTAWSEAAIDPEMLGKAFESLMSSTERKGSGAYYTPHALVREVCRSALTSGLSSELVSRDAVRSALDGSIIDSQSRELLLNSITQLRILDPACGSGAFLVHLLEELCALRTRLGDLRRPHLVRRDILTRTIFGVDLNPMAVWLCELRLWLAIAIEDPESDPFRVTPLPNLDRNIRVGDSLSGDGFRDPLHDRQGSRVAMLRSRYARASGPRKRSLGKTLDSLERDCALTICWQRIARLSAERRELLNMVRSRDLFGRRPYPAADARATLAELRRSLGSARSEMRRVRDGGGLPFSYSSGFADAAARGGFAIILGNPPWVRTHNLAPASRKILRERYVVYRNAAWSSGAEGAHAGKGFASQVDAAALFVERSAQLLQPGGTLSLVVPAKLWRSLAGGGVRHLLQASLELRELHDLTSAPRSFDAAVYPSVVTACRPSERLNDRALEIMSHRPEGVRRWRTSPAAIAFDRTPGSPWLIMPPDVRTAFDKMRSNGVPVSRTSLGRPVLGVKTGCNEAFLVSECNGIEHSLLRPVVRGDRVRRWTLLPPVERIIWTHDRHGPLRTLPPGAAHRLSRWRPELERRADSRGLERWWKLFRTDGADSTHPRVIWSDIGKEPRAAVLPEGDDSVPLNTCYVVKCQTLIDAEAFTAILNSRLSAAWLAALAEPARGGYSRFMGWTVALFPVPRDWARAAQILAPLTEAAMAGAPPSDPELLAKVLDAYMLSVDDVASLLQWNS